jgi:predicted ArsR family transcriptional regulator
MSEKNGQFDWGALVPRIIKPAKVAVIEALHYIDRPMSATELAKVLGGEFTVSGISYHLKSLANNGVTTKVGERKVRGAKEKFYALASAHHADSSAEAA